MKVKSKKGKIYEYDYKCVLVNSEDHEKLLLLSMIHDKPITKLMSDIIKHYGSKI